MTSFREAVAEILYDLSEHQIQAVKDGIVTDFYIEEKIEEIIQEVLSQLPESPRTGEEVGDALEFVEGYETALDAVRELNDN